MEKCTKSRFLKYSNLLLLFYLKYLLIITSVQKISLKIQRKLYDNYEPKQMSVYKGYLILSYTNGCDKKQFFVTFCRLFNIFQLFIIYLYNFFLFVVFSNVVDIKLFQKYKKKILYLLVLFIHCHVFYVFISKLKSLF